MSKTGINSIDDLRLVKYASAADFGLDTINKVLQQDLANFNAAMNEQLKFLAEPLSEQSRVYGTSGSLQFDELDEFGVPVSRKNTVGETVSFPLKFYGTAIGFTERAFALKTPGELIEKVLQGQRGYAETVIREIKKAIFNNTNYTFVDSLYNGVSLGVKRFINADGSVIPDAPDGTAFDGATHTHYIARAAALANTDVDAALTKVSEHGLTSGLKLFVNKANVSDLSGIGSTKFTPLSSAFINYSASDSTVVRMDMSDTSNYLAGYWGGLYEVWVKPWVPANYILAVSTDEAEKPLGYRQLPGLEGLRIDAENSQFPLIAKNMVAQFGFGVWNRLAGSVLYIGGTSWVNPTIS